MNLMTKRSFSFGMAMTLVGTAVGCGAPDDLDQANVEAAFATPRGDSLRPARIFDASGITGSVKSPTPTETPVRSENVSVGA